MLPVLWLMLLLLLSVMYCPDEKMKINRFVAVAIPRNCEYLRRFGKSTPLASQYTGESALPPRPATKIDMMYQAELMDLQNQREEAQQNTE